MAVETIQADPLRTPRSVCVYCGSGPGTDPLYVAGAQTLGHALADAGLELVYGGGSLGLMGETARASDAESGWTAHR